MKKSRLLVIVVGLMFVLAFAVSIKPSQAVVEGEVFCYGIIWKYCPYHPEGFVLRCTCEGGSYCFASWQDLCRPQQD